METSLTSILLGGTIILVSGIIDDIRGLKPMYKILFQVLAGLVIILRCKNRFYQQSLSQNLLPPLPKMVIPSYYLVLDYRYTNTINLIDGLDGLAAGVSMIASLSLMLAKRLGLTDITILSSMVAGACLGFILILILQESLWRYCLTLAFIGCDFHEGVMKVLLP